VLYRFKECSELSFRQVAPLANRQLVQADIHYARALKLHDLVAKVLTHTANLAIQPLHQGDVEDERGQFLDRTLLCHGSQYRNATGHTLDKLIGDRFINRDHVLFFVVIAGAQYFVYEVAVVGQKDQTLGVFIESADWKDTHAVIDEIDDVVGSSGFGGGLDAYRLVQRYKNKILSILRLNGLPVDLN